MSTTRKLGAGGAVPAMAVPKVGGGEVAIGNTGGWQMVVVYRGKHCPICRSYLKGLDGLYDEFRAGGTEVVAVSGDPPLRWRAVLRERRPPLHRSRAAAERLARRIRRRFSGIPRRFCAGDLAALPAGGCTARKGGQCGASRR